MRTLFLALFCISLLVGCGGKNSNPQPTLPTAPSGTPTGGKTTPTGGGVGWNTQTITELAVNECSGSDPAVCGCILTRVTALLSYQDYIQGNRINEVVQTLQREGTFQKCQNQGQRQQPLNRLF